MFLGFVERLTKEITSLAHQVTGENVVINPSGHKYYLNVI